MRELLNRYGGEKHLEVPEEIREGMLAAREEIAEMQN